MKRRADVVRFVYVLRDADGAPLYVGLTHNVTQRLKKHSAADYWSRVADVSVELVFGLDESAARELQLIRQLDPELNERDKPWPEVEGRRCLFFRYCGEAAATTRTARYGGKRAGVRVQHVCERHAERSFARYQREGAA